MPALYLSTHSAKPKRHRPYVRIEGAFNRDGQCFLETKKGELIGIATTPFHAKDGDIFGVTRIHEERDHMVADGVIWMPEEDYIRLDRTFVMQSPVEGFENFGEALDNALKTMSVLAPTFSARELAETALGVSKKEKCGSMDALVGAAKKAFTAFSEINNACKKIMAKRVGAPVVSQKPNFRYPGGRKRPGPML